MPKARVASPIADEQPTAERASRRIRHVNSAATSGVCAAPDLPDRLFRAVLPRHATASSPKTARIRLNLLTHARYPTLSLRSVAFCTESASVHLRWHASDESGLISNRGRRARSSELLSSRLGELESQRGDARAGHGRTGVRLGAGPDASDCLSPERCRARDRACWYAGEENAVDPAPIPQRCRAASRIQTHDKPRRRA